MEQVLSLIKLQCNCTFPELDDSQIYVWYASLSIKVTQLRFLSLFQDIKYFILELKIYLKHWISSEQNWDLWWRVTMVFRVPLFGLTRSGFAEDCKVIWWWWRDVLIANYSYRIISISGNPADNWPLFTSLCSKKVIVFTKNNKLICLYLVRCFVEFFRNSMLSRHKSFRPTSVDNITGKLEYLLLL